MSFRFSAYQEIVIIPISMKMTSEDTTRIKEKTRDKNIKKRKRRLVKEKQKKIKEVLYNIRERWKVKRKNKQKENDLKEE